MIPKVQLDDGGDTEAICDDRVQAGAVSRSELAAVKLPAALAYVLRVHPVPITKAAQTLPLYARLAKVMEKGPTCHSRYDSIAALTAAYAIVKCSGSLVDCNDRLVPGLML